MAVLGTQGDALRADVAAGEAAREVLVAELSAALAQQEADVSEAQRLRAELVNERIEVGGRATPRRRRRARSPTSRRRAASWRPRQLRARRAADLRAQLAAARQGAEEIGRAGGGAVAGGRAKDRVMDAAQRGRKHPRRVGADAGSDAVPGTRATMTLELGAGEAI